ncbi:MAG: DinB family protein [Gemmatimonadales bacterium]
MSIAESVLPEFDQEMASTRKLLERVPASAFEWMPHPKSMSMKRLAGHLANLPNWAVMTLDRTELDLEPPGGPAFQQPQFDGPADILAAFDTNVKAAREWIAKTNDADYLVTWSLKKAGQTLLSMPRVVCLRSFVLNHMIHHRGQLSVYLRLRDVPVPGVYGPSADEAGM